MYTLENAIRREQLPDEVEKRYLEFIKADLAPRYAEFIGNEIQKAYLESYTDYGQNPLAARIRHGPPMRRFAKSSKRGYSRKSKTCFR
jgi:predicted Ser/Thr protein kinase